MLFPSHYGNNKYSAITYRTRQQRKALWHNDCPSHKLLRHLTLTHDHDNKCGEGVQE